MMMSLAYLLLGVALAFVGWWAYKRFRPRKKRSLSSLKKELLKLTHDSGVTERLIDAERSRHPELSDAAIFRRVIRRLRRDRGR